MHREYIKIAAAALLRTFFVFKAPVLKQFDLKKQQSYEG